MKSKKKNGFTLAELLGVITVLALIVLLVVPAVTKNIARGKQNLYEVQLENFEKAAKDWMALHMLELPEEDINTTITLGCLKAEGLLETSIENPVSGEQFPNDMVVKIQTGSNQLIYMVDESSGTNSDVAIPTSKCHFNNTAITN